MLPTPELASWVSPAARTHFDAVVRQPTALPEDIESRRHYYDAINAARLEEALGAYPATVVDRTISGVPVHDVSPIGAKSPGLLICLHGGAFLWGAGAGALLEAVPVAAVTGMRVVAVDYRLAPEHKFPAAVDDVLAVYSALRAETNEAIGMFGCSAGAYLTAQVVARLIAGERPIPQAIALLHGSGVDVGGDSLALAGQLNGLPGAADIQRMHDLPYFEGTDADDPLVFPGEHPAMLAAFPSTLLITGTRDFAASSVAVMHRRLVAAAAPAQFVLFDGLWHAHHVDTILPESQEVYALMAAHFRAHLRRS